MRNSWLRQVRLALGLDRTPTAPVRRRLGVESLEDRSVPAVFTVTSLLDTVDANDGVLTLREAISSANADAAADDITFQPGLTGTISLTGGQMYIENPVTITGNGAANTVVDAQQRSRIFQINPTAGDVTLARLTLRNGKVPLGTFGGAAVLFNSSGTLTVSESTLSDNSADDGGAIAAYEAGSAGMPFS